MKMTRKQANMEIIRHLKHHLTMYPDIRLGQALRNIGIVVDFIVEGENTPRWSNHFNEEPDKMLERMKKIKKEGFK